MKKSFFTICILAILCGVFSSTAIGQNSLNFDGINDRVNCGNDPSVQISGTQITLEAWIYPTAWKANVWEGSIINKEQNSPDFGYMLRCGDGGKLSFNLGNGGWNEIVSSSGALTLNTWQHVAGTYDGSKMRLYVNGVAIDSSSQSFSLSSPNQNLTIGNWSNPSSNRTFSGSIDEVRIWNIARSETEINNAMNSEFCSIPSDLIAYYKLNEGVASGNNLGVDTTFDYSNNQNNGLLAGFALSGTSSNWVSGNSILPLGQTSINKETIMAADTAVCDGFGTTISTNSSESGVIYTLKDAANGNTIDGPTNGTGSALSFTTGNLSSSTDYFVEGVSNQSLVNGAGTALDLKGTNQYVDIGNVSALDFSNTDAFTIEAWVNSRNITNPGMIFAKMFDADPFIGYAVMTNANGNVMLYLISDNPTQNFIYLETNNSVLSANTFEHVAVTYDGSSNANGVRIYVNGVSVPFTANQNTLTGNIQTTAPVNIGARTGARNLDATVDEVRVWDYVRTNSEVSANMNTRFLGTETGLLAYYTFEDGTGSSTVTDHTSNQNNGTLMNMNASTDWVSGFGASAAACSTNSDTINVLVSPQTITYTESACESYTWMGNTYTQSGTYIDSTLISQGCYSVMTLDLTIISINKETIMAADTAVCDGFSTTITTNSSDTNVIYTLKNAANGITIDGPTNGTGSTLSFTTGNLSSSTDYFVEGVSNQSLVNGAGTALDLKGTNQYVDIGNVSALDFSNTDAFTIEAWVNSRNITNPGMIFAKMFDADPFIGYAVMTNANGNVMLYLISDNPTQNFIYLETNNSVLSANTFEHVAVTYDGSSNANGVRIYVNGVSVPFTANQNTLTGNIQTTAPVNIGARTGARNLDATVDEVRVWDYVRTNSEVSANMNTRFLGTETGLLAYYTFEDGTGSSTVTDHTSNQNNGTLMNMNASTDWVSGFGASGAACSTNSDTVNVIVNFPTTGTDIITACDSYTWINGITYTENNNTATTTLTNALGCDSIVTLNLTLKKDLEFEWAEKTVNSTGIPFPHKVVTDSQGNIYSLSLFQGNVTMGGVSFTNQGNFDGFLTKQNAAGNTVWGLQIASSGNDFIYALNVDPFGNTIISGRIGANASIGSLALNNSQVTLLYAKIDPNGNLIWHKEFAASDCAAGGISVDNSGNIYSTGTISGTSISIGSNTFNTTGLDVFVLKMDSSGNPLWVSKPQSSTGFDAGQGIDLDDSLNIYITGDFDGTVNFGGNSLSSAGGRDVFVTKLDSAGNFVWANRMGSNLVMNATTREEVHDLAVDQNGNIITVGTFGGNASFGNTNLISSGLQDIFVQKHSTNGSLVWVKKMGGAAQDKAFGVDVDNYDNIYVTGEFRSTANFGSFIETTQGSNDVFLQKLDPNGNVAWVEAYGTIGAGITGRDVTLDNRSNIIVGGANSITAYIGTDTLAGRGSFTFKLSETALSYSNDVILACDSYTWIDGITYTSSNNSATQTFTNAIGCDSIVTLDLTINNSNTGVDVITACDSYTWINGVTYTSNNNTALDTLVNADGCDSIVTLDLTIISINKETLTATDPAVCDGFSTTITTNSSDTNVTYTLKNAANGNTIDGPTNGTGSALSFTTGNINSSTDYFVEGATNQSLINGTGTALDLKGTNQYVDIGNVSALDFSNTDAFTIEAWVNSRNSSNPGMIFAKMFNADPYIGYAVMTNANGNVMLYLISDNPTQNFIYLQTNNSVISANTFEHVAVTYDGSSNANGVKIYVNGVLEPFTANQNTLTGNIQTTAPVNIGARTGAVNLDATVDELRVWDYVRTNSEVSANMNTRFLGSETGLVAYYTFEDGTGSSTVTDHSSNQNNGTLMNMNASTDWVSGFGASGAACSTNSDTVNVIVNFPTTGTDIITACDSYTWINGITYTSSNNTAMDTLTNAAGCDSIVTLDLTINNSTTGVDVIAACDSYTWINGVTYTSSNNTAMDTLVNAAGCDSIVTLDLTINNSNTGVDVITACDSYTWINGVTYTSNNNTAMDTLVNAAGCDSIVTLDLTINNSNTGVDVITACDSYTWINGVTYTSSNSTAMDTLVNAAGCDSIVTLDLTINNSTTSTDVITACDTYTWMNGVTYTSSNNTAMDTLVNAAGCDSIVTLDLTINNSNTGVDAITACDSYTWINGVTYTSSNNTVIDTLVNAAGCDSIVTLDLTINNSNTGVDVITACDSYTWINGVTYTSSNNTAIDTLVNAAGCDSIVTLDLTINNSNTGVDVITACDRYTWINGVTYTSSNNTAIDTLVNAAGCDSIVTLDLTINNSAITQVSDTACDTYFWLTNGATYTSTGVYSDTLQTINGCDSIVTLDLTINNSNTGVDVITVCDRYTWINGVTYTTSNNTAMDTLVNAAGCDSVVTLNLTIDTLDLSIINFGDSLFANQPNARYQWINCDNGNAILIGDTLQGFAPKDTGNYAVIITKDACSDTSNCEPIIPSSIFENTTIENVSIYPNPSTDKVFIDFSETNFEGLISIYNIHGSLVNSRTIAKERIIEIPLNYASGVYFIKIQKNNSQQIHIEKLIIK